MKKLIATLILGLTIYSLFACGGGGGGGNGGQQSVLKVVNASVNVKALDLNVDQEIFFAGIPAGQSSEFQEILAGDRMLLFKEVEEPNRNLEIQNNFDFGTPYTIIVSESGANLVPIITLNDRSNTVPGKFRVRAINASTRAGSINLRLVPGRVGSKVAQYASLRADAATATPAVSPSVAPTSQSTLAPTKIPTTQATAEATASQTPESETTATPTPKASASASPTVSTTLLPAGPVTIASGLTFQEVSGYIDVPSSDYKIVVDASGSSPSDTGVITFTAGQILTILIRDNPSGGVAIDRLNDKP